MNQPTRRRFLAMTGAGAAAISAAAVAPGALASTRDTAGQQHGDDLGSVEGPIVAYVDDLSAGEVTVMVGEHEISVVDHDLAARIARHGRTEA